LRECGRGYVCASPPPVREAMLRASMHSAYAHVAVLTLRRLVAWASALRLQLIMRSGLADEVDQQSSELRPLIFLERSEFRA